MSLSQLIDRAVTVGGVPGIVVELHDGDRSWCGAAGLADTATGRARDRADRFRIGSITKTFVATVLLQVAAEQHVDLDEPVARRLRGAPGDVTVRQLLNHTSGLFNYTLAREELNRHAAHPPSLLVEIAAAHPRQFPPGEGWGYSNTNYVLAGLLVERLTGGTVAGEIERRIAAPLGLSDTWLPAGGEHGIRGRHARHYTRMHGPGTAVLDATEFDPALFWAAGAMISSTGDLARFFRALLGGRLLAPALQEQLTVTVPAVDWLPDAAYGLGISTVGVPGAGEAWGMGGATFGSWTYAYGSPDGRRMLVANVNGDWTDGGWDDPIGIFTEALQIGLGAA